MKSPTRIGLPPGKRVLYIERHAKEYDPFPVDAVQTHSRGMIRREGHYRLWLHTSDHIYGTYIALWDNGKIERITVRADEGDEVVLIKNADAIGE